jgi:hypothetical protein
MHLFGLIGEMPPDGTGAPGEASSIHAVATPIPSDVIDAGLDVIVSPVEGVNGACGETGLFRATLAWMPAR